MVEPIRTFILECDTTDPGLGRERVCRLVTPISAEDRNDYWLAEVDPPFPGRSSGREPHGFSHVIVATKWKGQSLLDTDLKFIPVYVLRILDCEVIATRICGPDQMSLFLWCVARPAR